MHLYAPVNNLLVTTCVYSLLWQEMFWPEFYLITSLHLPPLCHKMGD